MSRPPTRGNDASPRTVERPRDGGPPPATTITSACTDLAFIEAGQKLYAFSLVSTSHMRAIRGGRQSLLRFAEHYPRTTPAVYPTLWTENTRIANKRLEEWMTTPGNPFVERNEGDGAELEARAGLPQHSDHGPAEPEGTGVLTIARQSLRSSQRAEASILKDLVEQVHRLASTQTELHATVMSMKSTIERQEWELQEMSHQLLETREEARIGSEKLKEEIRLCNATIKQLTTTKTSWAAVAANGSNQPPPDTTLPSQPRPIATPATLPGVNVDLSSMQNPLPELKETRVIRQRVAEALKAHESTENIRCVGIARRAGDPHRFKACFNSHEDARLVRTNVAWVESHFRGARLVGDQWHTIKVDRVPKDVICDHSMIKIRENACEAVGAENNVVVRKIHFLGKPTPDKNYCSIAVYLDSSDAANSLLQRQIMEFGGEVAYTREFIRLPTHSPLLQVPKIWT